MRCSRRTKFRFIGKFVRHVAAQEQHRRQCYNPKTQQLVFLYRHWRWFGIGNLFVIPIWCITATIVVEFSSWTGCSVLLVVNIRNDEVVRSKFGRISLRQPEGRISFSLCSWDFRSTVFQRRVPDFRHSSQDGNICFGGPCFWGLNGSWESDAGCGEDCRSRC